ncbi:DegT/DnrJ/EryC1/StrS aminotransferase family protein [Halobacteriovorax sp. HLS]|uniref:DegT/DnrJ/EryC1/StrS family aminotransferase n=1 Tax=Halobacteriovorax sp. HLS TaxID=2234000 RepID=UPI000FDC3189|nr:DegT/DnrJ/EryC1/StrS family aminotransferase [Halobacteriovorax sp. HLS]
MFKFWRNNSEELAMVEKAIKSGLKGHYIEEFENKFAERTKSKYAISLNSGTSALEVSMMALDLKPGDEVIVPALTFSASCFAPLYVGATPVFADIDPDTFLISADSIRKNITPKTKAIITVSLYGELPDYNEITQICSEHNLKLVEDNAQSFDAKLNDKLQGSFGDFSIYSLQRSKHLTTGDGGVLTTNNEKLALYARKLSDLGYSTLQASPGSHLKDKNKLQRPDFLRHDLLGKNFRLPEVCAAMAISQLDKATHLSNLRKKIGQLYLEATKEFSNIIKVQKNIENSEHSYWAFSFMLHENIDWDVFKSKFMELGGHQYYGCWQLAYLEPALRGQKIGNQLFEKGLCPNSEKAQQRMVQLKTNFETIHMAQEQANILKETLIYFSKNL